METKVLSKRAQTLASSVMLLATANPKVAGSMAHKRFEILIAQCKDGATPTVEQLLKAGYRMDDVRHDSAHGFIAVGAEAIKAAKVEVEKRAAEELDRARALVAAADKNKK